MNGKSKRYEILNIEFAEKHSKTDVLSLIIVRYNLDRFKVLPFLGRTPEEEMKNDCHRRMLSLYTLDLQKLRIFSNKRSGTS